MADQAESVNLISKDFNSINHMQSSLRNLLFEFLYSILKDDEMSLPVSFILTLIQFFQIYYFAFHPVLYQMWNSDITENIAAVFGYTGIIHIYRDSFWTIFVVLLYFGVCIILLFTIGFVYCFFTVKRQKQVSNIIVGCMRIMVNLFLTILYIPFLDLFISTFHCVQSKDPASLNQEVLSMYNEITCWQGMHIFHVTCGIICAILLIVMQYFFSLLYFDGIHNENKSNSKKNSKQLVGLQVYETLLIICYIFLDSKDYIAVLVIVYLGGALITFYLIHTLAPFNHPIVQKYWSLFTTLNMWTAIMLTMGYLTEKRIFHGIIYAWAIGLPLMAFIIFWSPLERTSKENSINVNVNKFNTPQELIDHTIYIHRLIKNDQKKTSTGQLLNGYIEFHNKTCLNPLCPLKKVKFTSAMWKKQKKGLNSNQNQAQQKMDKRYLLCFETIGRLFEIGIANFPTNISLRIYYSVYLMGTMKSKQHALNEVVDAENFKCTLDEQFILYFIRRTIETQISELSKDGGGDYSEQRDLEGKIRHFKAAMEQTVTLLMEFWSQFSDDKPDLIKLYDIGSKLFPLKLLVDDMWKKISRSKGEQIPKVLRIYSKYLIDIFNDKQGGIELLDKASKMEVAFHQRKDIHLSYASDINIDGQEDGIIFMTMEEERLGQIVSVNLSCASLFGYSKTELLNKNVTNIQPSIYAKHHDEILKRFLETNETVISNKDKPLYGKNKAGYIFPIILHVKPVYHALKDGIEFFSLFRKEKMLRNYAYLITSQDGQIKDISASCLNILGIDQKTINLQQVMITSLFTEIFNEQDEYKGKSGKSIEYTFPKITEDNVQFGKGSTTIKVTVWLQEISFKVKEQVGYIIKVEQQQKKVQKPKIAQSKKAQSVKGSLGINNNVNESLNVSQQQAAQLTASFVFKLTVQDEDLQYNGEYFEGQVYSDLPNNTCIVEQSEVGGMPGSETSNLFLNQTANVIMLKSSRQDDKKKDEKKEEVQEEVQKINYGANIKIVRLMGNGFYEVDRDESNSDMSEEESSDEKKEKNFREHNQIDEQQNEFAESGFHSSKELNEELSKQSESTAVKTLKYFSAFVVLIMIMIAALNYGIKISKINTESDLLNQILMSSNRIAEINQIISFTRELNMLNLGVRFPQYIIKSGTNASNSSDEQYMRDQIEKSIKLVEQLTIDIQKQQVISSPQISIQFDNANQKLFDENYVTQQLISKSHNILRLSLKEITQTQSDAFFVIYNGLNDYIKVFFTMYSDINNLAVDNVSDINSASTVFLVVSICIMFFFSIVLTILLGRTIFAKQMILSVFLDIPEKTAKYLYSKCENFLTQLGSGEEDEVHSEMEIFVDDKEAGDEQRASVFGRKKKKFKNADRGSFNFLIKMLFIAIFIEAYFILDYILGNIQVEVIDGLLNEFNHTAIAESYYSYALNAELQIVLDNSWTIQNERSSIMLPLLIDQMYKIDSTVHEEHAKNTERHNNSVAYMINFENVMFKDCCPIIVQQKGASQIECAAFSNGVVTQGMITVVIRYFQLMRYIKDRFDWVLNVNNSGKVFNFTEQGFKKTYNFSANNTLYNVLNMLRMPDIYELVAIQTQYIKAAFRFLQQIYMQEMSLLFDNYSVQRILLLVLFIIVLVFASFMCWIPFLGQLNKEIWSTKCLLSFIPVDEMTKIKSISLFIREFIIDRKI